MLTVENLSLTKGKRPILRSLSLQCPTGCVTLLLGKSGAGKSSVLRCLAQLETPDSGRITLNDEPLDKLPPAQRALRLSFIAQSYALFPHLTALENCAQRLTLVLKLDRETARNRALETLSRLGMETYATFYPSQLSGGQQQRVAIARALALNPDFLLLDEPTSALDPFHTASLIAIIQQLRSQGKGIVISTQDMGFASKLLERAYLLDEGRIVDGYPQSCGQLLHFLDEISIENN
ncbi:MAG: ATP-binding cassette domain-containing protein [Parachlamydia sp.]|nr:ATP-binding cassette domain-containing protein [Parachlamydia sp.]